jgi:hypothetical protein
VKRGLDLLTQGWYSRAYDRFEEVWTHTESSGADELVRASGAVPRGNHNGIPVYEFQWLGPGVRAAAKGRRLFVLPSGASGPVLDHELGHVAFDSLFGPSPRPRTSTGWPC